MTQDNDHTHSIESLLKNEPWMRGLARTLLQDDAAAADAVQQTFAAALEHPPSQAGAERGWLATVTRNFARQGHRRDVSRRTRERAAAKPEALPDTAALVEREELRRQVVEAVLELDEPYRSTVLWRFFEELTPKEIGARTGTPAATVRTRLKRALGHLRERLDGLHAGDRRQWAVMLVPLAGGSEAEAAPAAGAAAWWLRGAAAAGVLAIGAWWVGAGGDAPSQPQALEGGDAEAVAAAGPRRRPLPPVDAALADPAANIAAAGPNAAAPRAEEPDREVPEFLRARVEGRAGQLTAAGGGARTEHAVATGLHWLVRHQSPDGSWRTRSFHALCKEKRCEGDGSSDDYTTGTTALACLAFLGAGHAPGRGAHAAIARRGLEWLRAQQRADGAINAHVADGHGMYGHAMAAMALCEASALSEGAGTTGYAAAGQRAVNFLIQAQNPGLGWRYGVKPGDNDTSVTAWCTQALWVAQSLGFTVADPRLPERAPLEDAANWVDQVTDRAFFKTGYTQRGDNGARLPEAQQNRPTESMTAAGLAIRLAAGQSWSDAAVVGGGGLLTNLPPAWDSRSGIDYYYWYWGTHALAQLRGPLWKRWNGALAPVLVAGQQRGGHADGSWDPTSAWGPAGGRVYATALNVLTLEAYYRYPAATTPAASATAAVRDDEIGGRVLGPTASLSELVRVIAAREQDGEWVLQSRAPVAPDGTYTLDRLRGGPFRVRPQLEDRSRYVVREPEFLVVPGGTSGVEFQLSLAPRVALSVIDAASGAPVPGLTASPQVADSAVGSLLVFFPAASNPAGWPVTITAEGYLTTTITVQAPGEGRADHPEPVRLRRVHRVHGLVQLQDGSPAASGMAVVERIGEPGAGLPGAVVGHISSAGQIVVPALPGGRYRIHLLVQGHPVGTREFEVADQEVRLEMPVPDGPRAAFVPARQWRTQRNVELSVDFDDTPIREALDALEYATGVRLIGAGDWSAAASQEVCINLTVDGVTLEDILSLTADMTQLDFDRSTGLLRPKRE